MAGEEKLENLLARMSPTLRPGEFVFCFLGHAKYGDHPELEPIGSFMESEGLTMVVPKNKADEHGVEYESVFKCITLMVLQFGCHRVDGGFLRQTNQARN